MGELINPVHDPYAKVWDIRYARFACPDLDKMEKFCHIFGLLTLSKTETLLVMRGYGEDAAVHITQKEATSRFIGIGVEVASQADLERFAEKTGLPVKEYDGPGGGKVVTIMTPEACQVEVLHGGKKLSPILETMPSVPANYANERESNWAKNKRVGYVSRVNQPSGPLGTFTPYNFTDYEANTMENNKSRASHCMRLGHLVLGVKDLRASESWWKQHFGFITSDEIHFPEGKEHVMGTFMRCDRGDAYTDHHTLFMIGMPDTGYEFNHAAYEVANMDDLFAGHTLLKQTDYHHSWGIGRHIEGSQIFDYWYDPFGHKMEHWTDGDQLNRSSGSNRADTVSLMGAQWGPTDGRASMAPFPSKL